MKHALAVSMLALASFSPGVVAAQEGSDPSTIRLQNGFDPIGAEVHHLDADGRDVYFIDEGPRDGRPVVFIGGQGTSLEAFQLTEFARTSREALGLRVISVERNGFGDSPFDRNLGYADYVNEVLAVLDHLQVGEFALMAISGGGAYAAHLASTVPDRVISLHLGAASPSTLPTRSDRNCEKSFAEARADALRWTHNPQMWWGVPGSPVLVIPGWQDRAYADATRSFYVAGQMGDPSALAHENLLPCSEDAVVDASLITSPAYLYWGEVDTAVPVAAMEQWQEALPNIARATIYPDEGHTVQYRHWVQIMADMAGHGDYTVVCRNGETQLVASDEVTADDQLDLCAWYQAD